jgi:mRNA-degrading endonuclease toxin of MazEF toxin-antitoxin module
MPSPTSVTVKTGDIFWCEPDPQDTVGHEQEKDRPWVIVSLTSLHRGKCVVGIPLTKNTSIACSHLIAIPKEELVLDGGVAPFDCTALTDQIRALDRTRFRRKAGTITPKGLNGIKLGLERLFNL